MSHEKTLKKKGIRDTLKALDDFKNSEKAYKVMSFDM